MPATTESAAHSKPIDRERVREELLLREELRREIEIAAETAVKSRGRWSFLRGPAVATAVGGLLLNLFGYVSAHYQKQQARDQALMEKQIAVATAITNDLPNTLMTFASMRKARLWLDDERNKTADARTPDLGLDRAEQTKLYFDLWKAYLASRKIESMIAELRIFYASDRIKPLIDAEDAALRAIADAHTIPELRERLSKEDGPRKQLLAAMSETIRERSR